MHHRDLQWRGRHDIPFIRRVDLRQNLAQRAFSRAVFANQRMATAFLNLKADAVQRHNPGETLRDILESKETHRKYPRCFSEIGSPNFSMTCIMSSQTRRFSGGAWLRNRYEGW